MLNKPQHGFIQPADAAFVAYPTDVSAPVRDNGHGLLWVASHRFAVAVHHARDKGVVPGTDGEDWDRDLVDVGDAADRLVVSVHVELGPIDLVHDGRVHALERLAAAVHPLGLLGYARVVVGELPDKRRCQLVRKRVRGRQGLGARADVKAVGDGHERGKRVGGGMVARVPQEHVGPHGEPDANKPGARLAKHALGGRECIGHVLGVVVG